SQGRGDRNVSRRLPPVAASSPERHLTLVHNGIHHLPLNEEVRSEISRSSRAHRRSRSSVCSFNLRTEARSSFKEVFFAARSAGRSSFSRSRETSASSDDGFSSTLMTRASDGRLDAPP